MTALPPNVEASRTASTVFLGGATKLSSGGIEIEDERAQRSHDIIKTQARFFNVVNLTVGKVNARGRFFATERLSRWSSCCRR